ncbi:hypothetical protein R3P38DRAFT_2506619 [Favolaschia claudopus]|uniref:Uncharacterized protein n=1 Tax=Favolaschia claudopus TaxID=2862362 RepID=A0AAW0D7B4_9AGAR
MPRPVHIWDRPSSIATPVPRAQTAPPYALARNEVTDEVESDDAYGYFKFIHVTLAKKAPHGSTDLQVHVPTDFPFTKFLFSRKARSKPRFTRAPSFEEAQVALCVDPDKKTITVQSLTQPLLKVQQYVHFPLTPNPLHLHHAMDGIALFHAFLQCTNTFNPIWGISLEMHRMKGQYPTWEPEGNLISDGSVCIQSDRSISYGFKINSSFPQDLFLSIFYFDPEAFTIHPVYQRQQFQKAPIKSHDSSLIAPHGSNCKWEFGLRPGHSSSSGFLRFFLTPHFLDLRWMSQRVEPFASNFVSIGQWRTPKEAFQNVPTWDVLTLLVTVTGSEN